jgi:hypothetical protein
LRVFQLGNVHKLRKGDTTKFHETLQFMAL